MSAQFGDTDHRNGDDGFAIGMRLAEGPIDLSWHHCSTTSEFLGEFFALHGAKQKLDYNETRHAIGYLVNELLENAVKFRAPGDILIRSSLEGDCFELRLTNLIDQETSMRFQAMLAEVTSRDPGELLIERIEANAADASSSGSGLGLLTLMSDYGARLGWTFQPAEGERIRLDAYAQLRLA